MGNKKCVLTVHIRNQSTVKQNTKAVFISLFSILNNIIKVLLPGLSSRLLEEKEASRTDPGLK
jgi:hypothetical protein